MVRAMVVLAGKGPEVPVPVPGEVPAAAVLLAGKVSTLLPVVGLVPNAAVTPLGRPEAARVTLPVKPPRPATETVSVALWPGARVTVAAERESVKLGAATALTVSAMVVLAVTLP